MQKTLRKLISENAELNAIVLNNPEEKYLGFPRYTINKSEQIKGIMIITGTEQSIRAKNNIKPFKWKINTIFHPALDYIVIN